MACRAESAHHHWYVALASSFCFVAVLALYITSDPTISLHLSPLYAPHAQRHLSNSDSAALGAAAHRLTRPGVIVNGHMQLSTHLPASRHSEPEAKRDNPPIVRSLAWPPLHTCFYVCFLLAMPMMFATWLRRKAHRELALMTFTSDSLGTLGPSKTSPSRPPSSNWSKPGGWVRKQQPAAKTVNEKATSTSYAYQQNPQKAFFAMHQANMEEEVFEEQMAVEHRVDERGVRLKWTKQANADFTTDLGMINILRGIKEKQYKVFVDVRDARMPRTSDHPGFRPLIRKAVAHIIVFTHCDMLDDIDVARLFIWSQKTYGTAAIFCMDLSGADFVREKHHSVAGLSIFKEAATQACSAAEEIKAFVCGLPNVGKSSLILPMVRDIHKRRRKKGEFHNPKVDSGIGKTKGVKGHLFIELENPHMVAHWGYHPCTLGHFLMDSPGLQFPPQVYLNEPEMYYKTLLLNISEPAVNHDPVSLADYMLWKCNRRQKYLYVEPLGLEGPTDNIQEVLLRLSRCETLAERRQAAETFVEMLKKGGFMKLVLDDLDLSEEEEKMAKEMHLTYEYDQVVMATNWVSGMWSRPVVRNRDGTLRRASAREAQLRRPDSGVWV